MNIKFELILDFLPKLVGYIPVTLGIVGTSLFFGIVFGFLITMAKLGNNKTLKSIAFGYTSVLRGTPTLIMLFLVFYGLPVLVNLLFKVDIYGWSKFTFSAIAMSLFSASNTSEIMRAAYEAVPKGQMEAGLSVGEHPFQVLVRIILPQALLIAIPNLGNMIINLLKEAALAYQIGMVDMMGRANLLNSLTFGARIVEVYISVSIIYWILSLLISKLFNVIEGSMSRYKSI